MIEKKNKSVQDTESASSITQHVKHIQALSGILEVQVNCFIQTKTHHKGGGKTKISTFNANFHEFLKK